MKGAKTSARFIPPYTPVIILINVIPTCMADKNFSESFNNSRDVFAPLLPSRPACSSLVLLLETSAISAKTKNHSTISAGLI